MNNYALISKQFPAFVKFAFVKFPLGVQHYFEDYDKIESSSKMSERRYKVNYI